MINIVLVEPEIPQNTGNIVRTCAATGAVLHIVRPMGFSVEDKYLKRAGLDYWHDADIRYYDSIDEVMAAAGDGAKMWFCTTKAPKSYHEVPIEDGCYLFFGRESKGLPESLLHKNLSSCIRIPMKNNIRSLNLANSVAIILFEGLRQGGFCGLESAGKL